EAHDMDGDGDLDLVIGTRSDGAFLFVNSGTRIEPVWPEEGVAILDTAGQQVMGSNAHLADWDRDGLLDLVLGSERGGAVWHRNTGTAAEPAFAPAATLVGKRRGARLANGADPTAPDTRTKVTVTDWNGDGHSDILIGDFATERIDLEPLSAERQKERDALDHERKVARTKLVDLMTRRHLLDEEGKPKDEELEARIQALDETYRDLRERLREYSTTETKMHGWVWLYLGGGAELEPATAGVEPVSSANASDGSVALEAELTRVDGGRLRLELELAVDPGWHVYAQLPEGSGYAATVPTVHLPDGAELLTPWATDGKAHDDPANPGVSWYEDRVTFTCELRVPEGTADEL
ncbi:MAG: hypothetical protein GY884_09290, partial [Proteobacteria bacterium]|nr:hypothetical protein [Pseudomonadota bacterium]